MSKAQAGSTAALLCSAAVLFAGAGPDSQPTHRLYAGALASRGYVVGSRLPASGLFRLDPSGAWQHLGFNHPQIDSLDFDPRDPRVLYIAAGNGCIRSADGGLTWKIATGWEMTEVKDVAVDPHQPDHIYLALPDGIGVSLDKGKTWTRRSEGILRKYTQTIRVDRSRAGRVLAGTEQGIFASENGGLAWNLAGAPGAMVTHLAQSPHDPALWLAATQNQGASWSHDGGHTWTPVPGIDSAHALYNAAWDPADPHRIAICGWTLGVLLSEDDGRTWKPRHQGLPSIHVWRVAFDPDHPGRLYAGVHEEALYVSNDAGRSWQRAGLEGSIVNSLNFVPLAGPHTEAFRSRVREIIQWNAAQAPPSDLTKGGFQTVAAKLWLGQDADWCSRRLESLLKDPTGDMFWMFPVTAVAYLGRDRLSASSRQALRRAWQTYMPYRGDTENHWLLYYTSLYLMAQLYPNEPGEAWYTGKSSAENFREAESYLLSWMDLTIAKGQGEYDCTHYMGVYLLPLSYLAAWADDPVMRRRARMMLDYVIADYAVENLDGIYVGAHARTDDRMVLEKWNGVASDFGWLLFGLGRPTPGYGYYALFYAVASAYQPPEVLHQIATHRSTPYLHRELKRTRHRWRYSDERNAPVYKTTYVCRDYAVGSNQGGLLQPIQQHSWDVTWAVPDPRGVRNTMFSLHPYSSPFELQMYFPWMPDFVTEAVVRSKRSYDSPDKFLGGSPYEQILQDRDTVIALYDIPSGTRFPHINGFFSQDLRNLEEHPSGWIFAQGGNAYLAYRPLAPYEWRPMEGGKRLYSPHLKNGTILQAASTREYASFDAFRQAVLALPLQVALEPTPSVRFRSLRGHALAFTYGRTPQVDGRPLRYDQWKPFEGPYVNAERGSRKLILTHGRLRRTLDFDTLTVTDEE